MNAKSLFAAAAIALIGTTAFAGELSEFSPVSTLSRAQVVAQLDRAPVQGENYGSVDTTVFAARSTTRTAVTAANRVDLKQYVVAGEAYGTVAPGASLRTRAEVRAEAIASMRGHVVDTTVEQTGN